MNWIGIYFDKANTKGLLTALCSISTDTFGAKILFFPLSSQALSAIAKASLASMHIERVSRKYYLPDKLLKKTKTYTLTQDNNEISLPFWDQRPQNNC
jgi:hypothetical protein